MTLSLQVYKFTKKVTTTHAIKIIAPFVRVQKATCVSFPCWLLAAVAFVVWPAVTAVVDLTVGLFLISIACGYPR